MFINIDENKRPKRAKIELARPNKTIIANVHEKFEPKLNLKLGNINELNFSIPYYVENKSNEMIKNENIEKIKELMYLKLTWGEYIEWFLIDNITESSSDNENMEIQAFSIGYELKRKKIDSYERTAINAVELFEEILEGTSWSVGDIDNSFKNLYRSFDEGKTDKFSLLTTGAETFGGVLVWDSIDKTVGIKELDNIGEYKGFSVNYDRLMSGLNRKRTTDDIVTRLYVYGNEGLTIDNVNPTRQKYIEDYSYFLYPFERDANKNVIKHSDYMSDELAHALLDNKELVDEYTPQIQSLQENITNKNSQLSTAMIMLDDLKFSLASARGLLDIAKAVEDEQLIQQRKSEVANLEAQVSQQESVVANLQSDIDDIQDEITSLQNAISVRSFTQDLLDELDPFIIEKEIEDARYIDEQELYAFGVSKFEEMREPKVVIETSLHGFLNSIEEQYYWDKIVLGDKMRVRQPRMNVDYKSTMIEMEVDLDTSDANVTIANFTNNVDEMDKFISILYSSENNSTILNNNKYKWDSVLDVRDEVTQLREAEIDATQKRITAGVNESVEIGERGIIITTPSFPNEMIIMQAGVIALSEDGGETWQTSIRPQGVVAETIIGKLIAGNNLVITNDSGSIVMDGDGLEIEADSIKIMSGGENPKNLVDDWNNMIINMENFADDGIVTPYEKSQINHEWNMIADSHAKLIESFVNNMGAETPENPYPQEYDDYLLAYENLRKYLFVNLQSDGYSLLNPDRMEENSPIDIGTYRMMVRSFTTAKDNFVLVVPMEYANAYMETLETSISLNYVKNDEVVAKINLSEEGTRIDGKLLEINSRTEFNHDLVMNAGLIQDANGDITIDLNKGEINLSKPLTINYIDVATKNDVDNIEMAYIASLSNDVGVVPTDADGNNGDFSNAYTSIHVYQRDIDVTNQDWNFSATASTGVSGTMIGNDYTVTGMSVDSGYVDITAIKGSTSLTKRFSVSKARRGATGGSGDSAKVIRLSVDKEVMTFNNDNTANPSSQVVNIEAFLQGMTGSPTFTATAYNGTTSLGNVTTGFSGTGLKRTLTQSAFTENTTHITISATLSGLTDKISIVKIRNGATGQDGKDSIVGYLTNEAIVLPAHSDGVVSNYELAEGYFKVYEGLTEVSNQADYSEVFGDNITINLNTVTGQYVVTNMEDSQDEGYFDIKATYKGTEIIKRISVTKSKQGVKGEDGVDGLDAKILYLSATGESMTFNYDNTPNPASQTISFTAKLQNISGTATFTAIPYNGNTAMSAITLGGSGNTRTLTQAQFPSTATRIQITATLSGLSDTISIVKLRNGEKGFDGENSVVGYLTNENITVPATSSGVVSSSDLAKATGTFRVFDGLEEKTTDSSVVFSVTSEIGLDGEINSNGVYTVSAITANAGTLEMRATYKGISIYKTLTLVKARAGVNGVSVTNIDNEYAVNTSANTAPTSGWDSTMPSRTSGEFLWVREKITYSNGSVETTGTRMVTGDKGDNGLDGKNALSVILLNENQSVATTSGRIATVAQTITIPFTAFVGINRVPATATVGTLPNGVTLSSNTAGTSTTDGVIVLSVAKNANLGGVTTAFDFGTIDITITADGVAVKKAFNWSKSISGANGTTARVFFVESDVSVIVRKEDGTHIPSSLTFYSYYKDGNTANKTAYARYWKIETTTDGGTWTTLATESTTMATTYKVNSIPLGIIGIRATTYSNTTLTTSHDTQSVMIVSNGESGVSIDKVLAEYAVSSSKDIAPTTGWQQTQPNRNAGQYTWRRDRIFYSDNSETVTNPVVMTGDKGDSGENAKLLFLTSTLENMIFNSDGSPNPASQIATVEAKLQNVTGTVSFSAKAYNGTTALTNSITLSGTGNSRTFSVANFPNNASHVTITATIGNLTDNISIFKLRHGQKGDEGTSGLDAYTVVLSNESHAFVGDVSNALAGTTSFNVIAYKGATRVSSTIGTISGLPDGMSATLSNNGTATSGVNISVTTTMVSPNGTLTIPITVDGKVFTKNFSYSIAFKGTKGDTGQAGKGISSTVIDYQNHTSGTVVPSGSWNTTIPTPIKGQYLWTRTRTTYTDNSVIPTYSVAYNATDGQNGNDGKGINSTVVTYQLGASGTTAPKGTWLSEPPTPVQGQYLWTKTVINYTSGNPSISYSTSYHATDGQKGDKGDTGDSGADAKVVTVTPTAQIFAKNENNVITPSTITIDGSTQNTTISAWRYSVNGGSFGTTLPTGVTRSGNVVTITGSTMTARTIAVKALDSSGNADTTTIAKVQDGATGETGAKGDNSIVGYLTNESITLGANSAGVVASFASATGTFKMFDGVTDVTGSASTVFSLNSMNGLTASINSSTGVYSVTAMSADTATAEFKAVYKGVTVIKTLTVSKSRAGEKGESGESGRSYWLTLSDSIVSRTPQGVYTPEKVTFNGFMKIGDGVPQSYSGRFIVQTSKDGNTFSDAYKSTSNESSHVFTVPDDIKSIRVKFYQSGGTTILLDEQSIPVLTDIDSGALDGATLLDKTEILSGTEIYTDKADDSVVHVEIDGKSVGGGSGKNLLKGSPTEDNKLTTAVTTRFDGVEYHGHLRADLEAGKTYTISYESNRKKSTVHETTEGSSSEGKVALWISNDERSFHIFVGAGGTFSVPATRTCIIRTNVYGTGLTADFWNIQIEEGSTATEYEPPAPTPDYPIAIHSLNDFDVVSSVGKRNLLPKSEKEISSTSSIINLFRSQLKYIEDETYTFSFDIQADKETSTPRIFINNSIIVYKVIPIKTSWSRVFVSFNYKKDDYQGATIAPHLYPVTVAGNVVRIKDWKIERGELSPYSLAPEDISYDTQSPTLYKTNILLSEPLRSVGDVKDRLFRDSDGLWKVERNVGERIVTGGMISYRYGLGAEGINTFYTSFPNAKYGIGVSISSHFKNVNGGWDVHQHGVGYSDHSNSTSKYFYFPNTLTGIAKTDSAGVATTKVNSWLSHNPMVVVYQLAVPVIETLPQADQDKLNNIATYLGSNYLYTIVDKTNILPSYVRENMNPTLHATFKSSGWYYRYKTSSELNKSIKETKNQYYLSTSSTSLSGGTWSDLAPTWDNEKYMWQRTLVTKIDGSTYYTPSENGTNISGAKGSDAIVGYLTNESISFGTDNNGNVSSGDLSKATGTFRVFDGLTEKTTDASCQFFKVSESGAVATISSNGIYSISSITQDNASVTFRATYKGVVIDKVLNLSKARKGDTGVSPVVGLLTNESITLPASNSGAVSSFTGATGTFNVYEGTVLKNASADYSVVSQSGITVSITQSGVYTVTAMTTGASVLSGTATLRAEYGGVSIDKALTVSKSMKGDTGKGITQTIVTYQNSSSGTVTPTGSWLASVPSPVKGQYLWTRTETRFSEGSPVFTYSVSYYATDGVGISSTAITYQQSTNGTTIPTGSWLATAPPPVKGRYLWTRTITTYTDGDVSTTYNTSYYGSDGQNATSYWINASVNAIKKDVSGNIVPNTITFSGFSKTGTSNPVAYSGRFIVQTSENGTSYTTRYTSSANQSSHTYTIPTDAKFVKARLYLAGGTSVLLDEQTVPVLVDAEGIEVGGRNLRVGTSSEWKTLNVPTNAWNVHVDYGIKISDLDLNVGDSITVGIDIDASESIYEYALRVEQRKDSANRSSVYSEWVKAGKTGRVYITTTIMADRPFLDILLQMNPATPPRPSQDTVKYRMLKIEKGNKATDWTEAPEDVDEKIGEKADQENLDAVIGDVDAVKEELTSKVDNATYAQQNASYNEWLAEVEGRASSADELSKLLDQRLEGAIINLNGHSQRWNSFNSFIQFNGENPEDPESLPTSISIAKGVTKNPDSGEMEISTGMILDDKSLTFYSGGEAVATITSQYLQIERGIFTKSAQIGRHKFEPLKSNNDHFILSYVGN